MGIDYFILLLLQPIDVNVLPQLLRCALYRYIHSFPSTTLPISLADCLATTRAQQLPFATENGN